MKLRTPHSALRTRKGFTLIELLIVIGLLGAMAVLVMPRMTASKSQAVDESMVLAEMSTIRQAFAHFAADCQPTSSDFKHFNSHGLAILLRSDVVSLTWSFPLTYDSRRGKGWRGPYLESESGRDINPAQPGQPPSGAVNVPVILDPRADMDSASDLQRYYRVLREPATGHLALVYIGENGILDSSVNPSASAGDAFFDSFLNHRQSSIPGDDLIRPLLVPN